MTQERKKDKISDEVRSKYTILNFSVKYFQNEIKLFPPHD